MKTTPPGRSLAAAVRAQLALLARFVGVMRRWQPQVVHVHTCSGFSFWRSGLDVLLARTLGARAVLHVHGARFHLFLAGLGPLEGWAARRVLHACSRVVVLGQVWAERLAPWCGPDRIAVVPNGVPVSSGPHPIRSPESTEFVCIANYERRKGLVDLVQAFARLPGVRRMRLTIVGADVEPDYRASLADAARAVGLEDQVALLGPVTPQDVRGFYQRADVFCLPSYDEGLPMSMLEAMAEGLPVIATPVGAVPEVLIEHIHGLVHQPGDIDGLARCMQQLIDKPLLRMNYGEAGRHVIEDRHSIDRMARLLVDVYRSALPWDRPAPRRARSHGGRPSDAGRPRSRPRHGPAG